MKIFGILPVRSGSKGIVNKNMRILNGKPLLYWSASTLSNSQYVNSAICSSDSSEMLEYALTLGLKNNGTRPSNLAKDESLIIDVIKYELEKAEEIEKRLFTHILLLQATTPTVIAEDIERAVNLAIASDADTIITGYHASQSHPSTMFTIDAEGSVNWILSSNERMARRQDLADVFIRTGILYLVKRETIMNGNIYGEKINAIVIPSERSITIDEEYDFKIAEYFMKEMKNA